MPENRRQLLCNGRCCWKWAWWPESKPWMRLFTFHIVLIPLKRYAFNYFPSCYAGIVGQTGLFSHGMAIDQWEGKLNSNLLKSIQEIDFMSHPAHTEGFVNIYMPENTVVIFLPIFDKMCTLFHMKGSTKNIKKSCLLWWAKTCRPYFSMLR